MRNSSTSFDRKVIKIAKEIAEAITALPKSWTPADVVDIWKGRKDKAPLLEYVYMELDNRYRWYPLYMTWHPRLRSTRNHPEHGPALFSAIRKEKA